MDTLDKIKKNKRLANLYKDDEYIKASDYRYEVQGSFPEWQWDSVNNVFIDKEYSNACL